MEKRKIISVFIFIAISSNLVYAQYQDLKGWYNLSFGFDIGKRVDLSIQQEFRFKSDLKKHDSHFTQLELSYRQNKLIRYQVGVRFNFDKKDYDFQIKDYDYYKFGTRIHADIILNQKIKNFKFESRTRVQLYTNKIRERAKVDDALLRERLMIEYKIPKLKLTPYVSAELFLEDYNDLTKKMKFGIEPNNYRLLTGVTYKYAKKQSIEFFYGYEKQINQVINKRNYIIGISIKFKF